MVFSMCCGCSDDVVDRPGCCSLGIQLFPQPASKPWAPVLIADTNLAQPERTFARIIEFGDGWLPAFYTDEDVQRGPELISDCRDKLMKMAGEAGRDPGTIQITAILRGGQVDGDLGPGRRNIDRPLLRRYADAGVDRALISLPTVTSEDSVRDVLERLAELVL